MSAGTIKIKAGFSMIELMMVMMIMAIMGSLALTQFLDYRTMARVSAGRQILSALRGGMKNQIRQAMLKCGRISSDFTTANYPVRNALLGALSNNDITYDTSGTRVCTTAQIPLANDRKLFDISGATLITPSYAYPRNPQTSTSGTQVITVVGNLYISYGGNPPNPCGTATFYKNLNTNVHWLIDDIRNEIFLATNTPGFNECAY